MPKHCCVPFCNSSKESNVSFHEFPSDTGRRNAWLIAIARDNFRPSDNSKVCRHHFQESDFVRLNTRTILKKNAIPTIFKGYPTFIVDKNNRDLLKRKENIDKSYDNKIKLLRQSNCASNEIQPLLETEKGKHSDKYISDLLKCKGNIDVSYANKIQKLSSASTTEAPNLLRQLTCSSNEIQSLPDIEKCKSNESQARMNASNLSHQLASLNHSSDDEAVTSNGEAVTSVPDTEEFESEDITQITSSTIPSNQLDETKCSSNDVSIPEGAQHCLGSSRIVRPKQPIIQPGLAHKKFNSLHFVHFNRSSPLKKGAISTIVKAYPSFTIEKDNHDILKCKANNNCDANRMLKISPLSKNEAAKFISQSTCSSVQNTNELKSESIPTQINFITIPSNKPAEVKSYLENQVESQPNLGKLRAIRPKQPIIPSSLAQKNVNSSICFVNDNKLTIKKDALPTIIKGCPPFFIGNNQRSLLKRKEIINDYSVNKIFKISSSKNESSNLLEQSTFSLNKNQPLSDTESRNSKMNASDLSHQLSSLNRSSDDEAVTSVPDIEEFESENIQSKINIITIPSNKFSEIKCSPNNLFIQARPQLNMDNFCTIAAQQPIIETGFANKYFKSMETQTKINQSYISDLHRKYKNMISLMCKKNKKIKSLETKLEEKSEKLEYFENSGLLKNVEKMKVINDEGLATKQIQFILNQISNLDKKTPRWSDAILRECVLLHATSPKAYEALEKTELFKLPTRSTLSRFVTSINAQTGKDGSNCDSESKVATEIVSCEPEFEVANETVSNDSIGDMEEDVYFDTSNFDML